MLARVKGYPPSLQLPLAVCRVGVAARRLEAGTTTTGNETPHLSHWRRMTESGRRHSNQSNKNQLSLQYGWLQLYETLTGGGFYL
jgi:hypothetical protein